jgi:hypothetical protein
MSRVLASEKPEATNRLVDTKLDHQHGLALDDLVDEMPPGLVSRDAGFGPSTFVRLTVPGSLKLTQPRSTASSSLRPLPG